MGLPKLSNGPTRKESAEADKEKKEIIFKATSMRDIDKPNEGGFRVNNIVKNAR